MIKQIRLQNWKSFEDATLYIDPLTVLIGANASGKSNALDALVFLQRIASGLDVRTTLGGNEIVPPLRGGMEWAVSKLQSYFVISATSEVTGLEFKLSSQQKIDSTYSFFVTVEEKSSTDRFYWTSNYSVEEKYSEVLNVHKNISYSDFDKMLNAIDTLQKEIKNYSYDDANYKYISDIISYTLNDIKVLHDIIGKFSTPDYQTIFVFDPIPSTIRNYSRFSKTLLPDASNLAGFLAALSEEDKARIETTLKKYLNHLPERDIKKVWAEPVGRLGSDAMLYCEEEWADGKTQIIDARGMSDGTLRFLAILTALLTRPEGSLLVIEEVDNGLHPSRMRLLIQAMREIGKERNIDVLVTTHNPALLDGLGPEMMPFVQVVHRDPKTGASKITPLDDIEQLPKLLASGSLGKITTRGELEESLKAQETACA